MFQSNVPVSAGDFHDRTKELRRLQDLVDQLSSGQPRWLAIVGRRKIGKTSLLLELERRSRGSALAFVVLDTLEQAPLSTRIFRLYALRVLDALLASELGLSLEALAHDPRRFRAALQRSTRLSRLPPALRADILELPERDVDSSFIRWVLDLPERLAGAAKVRILVAWDEFQELALLTDRRERIDVLPVMRSTWQRHRHVGYVISGSRRSMLTELVTSERSPFFQHFSVMDLGPFSQEDAVRLLLESAPADRPIPEHVARTAATLLGGHPFYLQLLGEELTRRPPPCDAGTLKEVVQDLLFSRTGRLALYFEGSWRTLVGRSTGLATSLEALAAGPRRLTEVAAAIGAASGSTVRYLERLGDVVARTEDGLYRLDDPTFGLWLRWRSPGGTVVPMSVVGDDAERRVAGHLAAMGFELVYQSRASRGAFDLLATRGPQQLGLQVKRSKLPLRFGKARWTRMEAEGRRFGWRWVVVAVLPPPGEDVVVLDPARARHGREVRLGQEAAIGNLLAWLDEPELE